MNKNIIEEKTIQSQESLPPYSSFAELVHGYLQDNITLADQKCTIVFTLVSVALFFLFGELLEELRKNKEIFFPDVWIIAAIVCFVIAAMFAFCVISPRLRGAADHIIYWKAISEHRNSSTFIEKVTQNSAEALAKQTLEHCYELSVICKKKYLLLTISLCWSGLGLGLFLIGGVRVLLHYKIFLDCP